MIAAVTGVDWGVISGLVVAVVVLTGGIISAVTWANRHIARPLRAVTGSAASPGVDAVPSMLDRVAEVKEGLDRNTEITAETAGIVRRLAAEHDQLTQRVTSNERTIAEVKGKIEGHLAGLPKA